MLFFLLLIVNTILYSQEIIPRFERITVENGLPENSVSCILQDHLGFLWFGTMNGLVKYDGYSMKVYRPDPTDMSSISRPSITALCEDSDSTLWVGTRLYKDGGGLNRFDRNTESFSQYLHNKLDSTSINSNYVISIYQDKAGNLWIGTDKGLSLFNETTNSFLNYFLIDSTTNQKSWTDSLGSKYGKIKSIVEDPNTGNLFVGSNITGLWEFDVNRKNFSRYTLPDSYQDSVIGSINALNVTKDENILIATESALIKYDSHQNRVKFYQEIPEFKHYSQYDFAVLLEDRSGIIWIGNYEEGLMIFNPNNNQLYRFTSKVHEHEEIIGSYVMSLFEDQSGIIWIGRQFYGLYKYDRKKWKFSYYKNDPLNLNSLSNGVVSSIYEDSKGILWISVFGKGLDQFDRKNNKFVNYQNIINNNFSLSDNYIWCFTEDPVEPGVYWIGTLNGLNKFELSKGIFTRFMFNPDNEDGIGYNEIMSLLIDREGILWVGTWGGGLDRFDRETSTFKHFRYNPKDTTSLSQDIVSVIYEDRVGTLWIGTDTQGLNRFNRNTEKFINFKSLMKDGRSSCITYIYEDLSGNFWLGTLKSGLHLFDRTNGVSIRNYTEKDGLPNNNIEGILEDDSGNLWISTENGLSKFNPKENSFKNYYDSDGLVGNIFTLRSSCRIESGEMFFGVLGSEYGLNYFHPDSIKVDTIPPNVVIDKISLFNRPGDKLIFEKYISILDEITLSYDQNDLRFDFLGLHYSEPEKNTYTYKLENYNDNWIDAGTQRNATYTNLDPGEYIFRVKAANRDGIWNEEGASISIIILPPWWVTIWAYIIYTIFIIAAIYFTWRLQLKRIRIKHDYEMSKFEAEKMHEVDEMKSRFFANISHEFRTPLTLIFGPAKDIAEETKETKTKQNAGIIKRNASRLYGLVNQLLDLSKLEAGKMNLEVSEQNIMPLLKGLVLSFTSLAERKDITLKFNTIEENLNVYIDKDKVEKIITNLLSNAFKFTPEGGNIDFTVEKMINDAEVRIADNGIGIPKERIDKIFDRFFQVDGSHTRESEGTGIGLAITKELVELHKGKIKVESKEDEGTTFTVLLPLGKEHLKPEEIVETDTQKETTETIEETELIPETESRKEKTDIDVLLDTDKPLLLIVEDNSDVRKYIISHLEDDCRIQEAIDGEDGLEQAFNHIPDLIISDVMMPKMDGFEMCNRLKTDERTSHIPIIMLTAKATSQDKIEGYETGADDYIMKPFDAAELKVRIKNLIEIRRKLQERFSSEDYSIPKELNSIDERFLNKVLKVINAHISDENFSIELLSKESAMSKEQIYKKLKALTGKSPSLFLRSIRLVRAKKMIKENKSTISEISYLVGFSSPAYFTKCFNEEFGYPPSDMQS